MQYLLMLNNQTKFINRQLDSTHVFINSDYVNYVKEKIEELQKKNTYQVGGKQIFLPFDLTQVLKSRLLTEMEDEKDE